jgi:glycosyltransferase involved in cell wall biosynthesis
VKISISATNPCHLYPLARELAAKGCLARYYSGYPRWKLADSGTMPIRTHSFRTNVVYGLQRFFPAWARPDPWTLYRWQDGSFDRWVGRVLEQSDFIHAMPGQSLRTFQGARRVGARTVLNHATGPVREWVRIMEPEYRQAGLKLADVCPYDAAYFAREEQEYALAQYHCVASTLVRDQLLGLGVPAERIWLAPYGAEPRLFHARGRIEPSAFRIIFAGYGGLRKGIRTLLDAVARLDRPDWEMHFYGGVAGEARDDLAAYSGRTPLSLHGAVSQETLSEAFRQGSVLVLPSLEEGFGLVVPQALNCGLPCLVSDRVGAKDLIRHRENGSIFACKDASALAEDLEWWHEHWHPVSETHGWEAPAQTLINLAREALSRQ